MTRVAMLFPGQGAQVPGMGRSVHDAFEPVRSLFKRGGEVLGMDLAGLCFDATAEELARPSNAQPALLVVGYAHATVYAAQYEIEPVVVAGHSLGEYTALAFAGALSFEDALLLVRRRGELMEQADPERRGTMAAVQGLPMAAVAQACDRGAHGEVVVCANHNAPDQVVISGHRSAVSRVSERLEAEGARVVALDVGGAFHSPLMAPCVGPLEQSLRDVSWATPRVPVVSSVDARAHQDAEGWVERLARQVVAPVQWWDTVQALEAWPVDVAVDVGPRKILADLVRRHSVVVGAHSLATRESRRALEQQLYSSHFSFLKRAIGVAVSVPNRNQDDDAYQEGVVEPLRELRALYRAIVEDDHPILPAHARRARTILETVLATKRVPEEEARDRVEALVRETGLETFFAEWIDR